MTEQSSLRPVRQLVDKACCPSAHYKTGVGTLIGEASLAAPFKTPALLVRVDQAGHHECDRVRVGTN
jgi:hypothetical protein